jgi:hypothetical protein
MKNSNFTKDEAININEDKYDMVLSHCVFHYFKDSNYAIKYYKKDDKQSQ